MPYLEMLPFLIVALGLGLYLGQRSTRGAFAQLRIAHSRSVSTIEQAENRYLDVLLRELANMIMQVDPDAMIANYRKAWGYEREMQKADEVRVEAEFKVLSLKYPLYEDFDLVGTRHFIPYGRTSDHLGDDAVAERYLDISKFMIVNNICDKIQRQFFSEREYEILVKTVRDQKDRALRAKISGAIDIYYAARRASGDTFGAAPYEDNRISVFSLPDIAGVKYGIHLKDTNEFATYSFFTHDDGHISETFCRSDNTFSKESVLMR